MVEQWSAYLLYQTKGVVYMKKIETEGESAGDFLIVFILCLKYLMT